MGARLLPNRIHIGAAHIYLGVPAPATGTPPTRTPIDADGVPTAGGQEIGYTEGTATFTYRQLKQEINAEQSLNPVGVFVSGEECMIEFTAMEQTYETLLAAFDNVGNEQTVDDDLFYGGDGVGLSDVLTRTVVLVSKRRNAAGKYIVLTLYNAYNPEGFVIGFGKTSVATYKMTMKGLVDASRVSGDRLFQYSVQRGATGVSASASTSPSASVSPSASASSTQSPSASKSPSASASPSS
jgi:hypothetical protein